MSWLLNSGKLLKCISRTGSSVKFKPCIFSYCLLSSSESDNPTKCPLEQEEYPVLNIFSNLVENWPFAISDSSCCISTRKALSTKSGINEHVLKRKAHDNSIDKLVGLNSKDEKKHKLSTLGSVRIETERWYYIRIGFFICLIQI